MKPTKQYRRSTSSGHRFVFSLKDLSNTKRFQLIKFQVMDEMKRVKSVEPGNQLLPLARIKKIMKLDEDVKMISAEAPLLFAKAAEMFIQELTLRAWVHTEQNKRRTLQRNDIAMAITKYGKWSTVALVPKIK
jgi:nuclear transcription factor Y, gamma